MDQEIRRQNKIPGSCDEFTRPEEITELEKFISRQIKDLDEEIDFDEESDKLTGSGQGYLKEEYPKEYSNLTEVIKEKPVQILPNIIHTIDTEKDLISEAYRDDIIAGEKSEPTEDFIKVPGKTYEGVTIPGKLTEGNIISNYTKDYPDNYEKVELEDTTKPDLPNELLKIAGNDILKPTKNFLQLDDTDKTKDPSRTREEIKVDQVSNPTEDFIRLGGTGNAHVDLSHLVTLGTHEISQATKDFITLDRSKDKDKVSSGLEKLSIGEEGALEDKVISLENVHESGTISENLETILVPEPDSIKEDLIKLSDNTTTLIPEVLVGLDNTKEVKEELPTYKDNLDAVSDESVPEFIDKVRIDVNDQLPKHKETLSGTDKRVDFSDLLVSGPKEVEISLPDHKEKVKVTEGKFDPSRQDLTVPDEKLPSSTKELLEPTPKEEGDINPKLVIGPEENERLVSQDKVTLEAEDQEFSSFLERLTADEGDVSLNSKESLTVTDPATIPNSLETLLVGEEIVPSKKGVEPIPENLHIEISASNDVDKVKIPGEVGDEVTVNTFKEPRPSDLGGNEWSEEDGFYDSNITRPGVDPKLPKKKDPIKIETSESDPTELFDKVLTINEGKFKKLKTDLVQRPADDTSGDDRKEWSEEDGFYDSNITRPGVDPVLPSFEEILLKPNDPSGEEEKLPSDSEVEELPAFSEEYEKELDELSKSRDSKDLTLYYTNIIKFAERLSELSNTGYGYKIASLVSAYLGSDEISKSKVESFEKELYAAITPSLAGESEGDWEKQKLENTEDTKTVALGGLVTIPNSENITEGLSKKRLVRTPHYKFPEVTGTIRGIKTGLNALLSPSTYIRFLAENTVGLMHGGTGEDLIKNDLVNTVRDKLLDATLAALINARNKLELKFGTSRHLLPKVNPEISPIPGTVRKDPVTGKKIIKARVINNTDTTFPVNAPDRRVLTDGFNAINSKTIEYDEEYRLKKLKRTDSYKLTKHYFTGAGVETTLADLCNRSPSRPLQSLKDFSEELKKSEYVMSAGKVTSTEYSNKIMTLDTNYYWEIILKPFVGSINGGMSYLPAIEEINNLNYLTHGVRTGYHYWIPINSFELSKSKLNSKSLSLFDGEISYPISMEYTNEFRLSIIDDQFKSFRNYFEKCVDVSTFNSTPHDASWYAIGGTGGKLTAVDKNYNLVAPYKNIAFNCKIYSMTPQKSTINKYDLLLVLKDFTEERMGESSPGDSELNVSFCIVGENPKVDLEQQKYVAKKLIKFNADLDTNVDTSDLNGKLMNPPKPAPPLNSNDLYSSIGPKQPPEWTPPLLGGRSRSISNKSILCI